MITRCLWRWRWVSSSMPNKVGAIGCCAAAGCAPAPGARRVTPVSAPDPAIASGSGIPEGASRCAGSSRGSVTPCGPDAVSYTHLDVYKRQELRCTYDPMSGRGSSSDGRRVKGVIHWVSAKDAVEAEIRLFNPLFTKENPDDVKEGQTWEDNLNPESMVKVTGYLEPSLRDIPIGQAVQFERVGYFCPDTDSTPEHPVFNRTVTLKDSWAKINK